MLQQQAYTCCPPSLTDDGLDCTGTGKRACEDRAGPTLVMLCYIIYYLVSVAHNQESLIQSLRHIIMHGYS